jgi:hypothetical protein
MNADAVTDRFWIGHSLMHWIMPIRKRSFSRFLLAYVSIFTEKVQAFDK